jgi:hypothetical protein
MDIYRLEEEIQPVPPQIYGEVTTHDHRTTLREELRY